MTGKTHYYSGIFLAVILTTVLELYTAISTEDVIVFCVGLILGSIAPDIDHAHSTISKKFGTIPSRIIQFFFGHRGAIHSITVGLIISMSLIVVIPWSGLGFFVGWLGHLLLDMLTPLGVPLFWPFSLSKYAILPRVTRLFKFLSTRRKRV